MSFSRGGCASCDFHPTGRRSVAFRLAHLDGACCQVGAGPSGTEGGLQEDPNPASSREVL